MLQKSLRRSHSINCSLYDLVWFGLVWLRDFSIFYDWPNVPTRLVCLVADKRILLGDIFAW
ncbi:MAG: hypothetical protein P1U77_12830 [Rubripirellula sp.]|nr:hypothetical protein [Rubripirellula sp.]